LNRSLTLPFTGRAIAKEEFKTYVLIIGFEL